MDDIISRQTAIDALKICDNNEDGINCHKCPLRDERWDGAWQDNETTCYRKLMRDSAKLLELPSVQPTQLTDEDKETIRIHLNAFKESLCNQGRWYEATEYEELIKRLLSTTSVHPDKDLIHLQREQAYMQGYEDGQKPRKGKWLNRRLLYMDVHMATCDQCGKRVVVGNFCPNCGADMRQRGDSDDNK